MNYKVKLFVIVFLAVCDISNLYAQNDDWGTWIDLSASKAIRSASLTLNGEFYTQNNNRDIERTSIGIDGNLPINSIMTFNAGYLLMNYNMSGYHEIRNRFFSTISLKWRLSDFVINHRERIQLTRKPGSGEGAINSMYWRNRLRVVYGENKWKVKPSATIESFYSLGNQGTKQFDEFRYSLALSYCQLKNQDIRLYGLWSDAVHKNFYVIGLEYEISL